MSKVTAYFSHAIRGKKGKDATSEDMNANCVKAQKVADWIRKNIPDLKLYVPAEHEDFVQIAYLEGMLTEKQILAVDCEILQNKTDFQIVLVEDGWTGGGIQVEIDAASAVGMCIFYIEDMEPTTLVWLRQMCADVLMAKELGDARNV